MNNTFIVSGSDIQEFAKSICKDLKATLLNRKIAYLTENELRIQIENKDLSNKHGYIIQSIANNVNDRIMELFLLADALKNLGCKNITAIIPYLAYSRQDKINQGEAFSLQCLAKLIKTSGINKIITIDLHNPHSVELFNLPVINLATTEIFAQVIKDRNNIVIVAPDTGAAHRARALAKLLDTQFIIAKKERTGSIVKVTDIPNAEIVANKNCYLVDDIVDTGNTLCSVAKRLEKFKPKAIYALISHGLFGNGAIRAIQKSCIKKIYVTNSVNNSIIKISKVRVLNASTLISNYLRRQAYDK